MHQIPVFQLRCRRRHPTIGISLSQTVGRHAVLKQHVYAPCTRYGVEHPGFIVGKHGLQIP